MLYPIRIASLLLIALLASASHLSACDFCGGPNAVRSAPGGGAWSSPSTWAAGAVPLAGSQVLIEPGSTVVLDVVTPALKSLVVEGVLRAAADRDVGMTADYIIAMGAGAVLEVGSASAPYTRRCVITLTGSDRAANISGVAPLTTGSKVLMSMDGGRIDLHGASRAKTPWTTLGATAAAGATAITLAAAPVYWAVGDQLCIAPTGFDPLQAERVTITAISGATVTITPALRHAHWGVLQTIAGVEVDERAEVGNLSRNILVQGDPASDAEGFGMHGMVMPGGQAFIEGVEFQRAGQAGLKARYPFHWHLVDRLAKDGVTGAGQYIRNCSFNSSFQRAVVIHGTNGVLVEGNVAYDVRNHCYVPSEDGDEVGNIFRGNLGMLIRRPLDGRFAFDTPNGSTQNEGSSSVFWLRNPDQAISGNHAAGAQDGSSYFFDRADSPAFEAVAKPAEPSDFLRGQRRPLEQQGLRPFRRPPVPHQPRHGRVHQQRRERRALLRAGLPRLPRQPLLEDDGRWVLAGERGVRHRQSDGRLCVGPAYRRRLRPRQHIHRPFREPARGTQRQRRLRTQRQRPR